MSTFSWVAVFYLFARVIKYAVDLEPSQTETLTERTPRKYQQPQPPPDKTPMRISFAILDLKPSIPICIDDVNRAYYQQLSKASEERAKGNSPEFELKDYQEARQYLIDFCAFMAYKN
jgi:hypothetical protein